MRCYQQLVSYQHEGQRLGPRPLRERFAIVFGNLGHARVHGLRIGRESIS